MDFFQSRYLRLKHSRAIQEESTEYHAQSGSEDHSEDEKNWHETPTFNVGVYAAAQIILISAEFAAIDASIEFEYDLGSQRIELWVPDSACSDRVRDLAIQCRAWHMIAKERRLEGSVVSQKKIQSIFESMNITVSDCSPKNTDFLVWHAPLAYFHKHREIGSPDCFDWSSDGCTSSPNHLFGFDFEDACQRHDFAYRNLGHQGRLTSQVRQEVDKNFLNDLKMICMRASHGRKPLCTFTRVIYFSGVRLFGSPDKAMYAFVGAVVVYVLLVGVVTYWMVRRHRRKVQTVKGSGSGNGTDHNSLSTLASGVRSRSPSLSIASHSATSSSALSRKFVIKKL
ncbi:hypothetical protein FKW77_006547 [Venturia effusa]|uniref:Phospholipase A2 domain-containing protein n=1 Tax=Venturia effusa TaxID=50376 RepID=A0A517L3I0_9PEZI|nr:hypothetical protein FKW77_006547 [Venturia effusa]